MGMLLHDQHGFIAARKAGIADSVIVFLVPVFFTYAGLRTDIGALDSWELWQWCLVILGTATLGKFGGCLLGARVAGRQAHESRIIAAMMNTRGLMELIVINVGYGLGGVIPPSVFTITLVTAPVVRLWMKQDIAISGKH